MTKNYKRILSLLFVLLVITSMTGVSYAFYEQKVNNEKSLSLVYTNEKLSINYLDGKDFDLKDIKPGDTYTKRISITNVSSNDVYATVSLMDVEKPNDANFTLSLFNSNNEEIYNSEITNIDTEIVKTVDLNAGKTLSYTVMIKNSGDSTISNFFADMLVYTEAVKADVKTIKNTILENNKVAEPLTSVGKEIATENEGLIKGIDDDGEAYIFRGNVVNNYLNFGGFTWRIVRINGDGTIRLILDGALDDNAAYNSNTDIVDDYTTKMNFDGSDAKSKLNVWLSGNLSDVSNYIVQSTFCNDNNVFKEENGVEYLNPYNRTFIDNNVSLVCNGTKVKNQIGLLNVDEVVMAGAFQDKSNMNLYLNNQNIKTGWWTMSGSQILADNNVVDGFVVLNNGSLAYDKKASMQFALRPVISLDKNTVVTGSGTNSDPYVVKAD